MNKVFLIEDHDEALKIWKKHNIKGLDLVHLDAHIDFGFHLAKPPEKLLKEAKNIKDFKRKLEYSLNFLHYHKDFNKQTNIGNYIYPAIEEGIVNNFYWVVPGGLKEFKECVKPIKNILRGILRQDCSNFSNTSHVTCNTLRKGIISTKLLGINFTICILEQLPILKQKILLDIDTDFLVIDSLVNADNTKNIGKRKPWIHPQDLVRALKEKIRNPQIITVAYSVNGGWTPLKYKHFGDELAVRFSPLRFKRRFETKEKAARYFNLFDSRGREEYYHKSIKLNPAYRCIDNNYGPLYLSLRKYSFAKEEFKKILRADKAHAGAIFGLGEIALQGKDFKKAKKYFFSALRFTDYRIFNRLKKPLVFKLAKTEFALRNFNPAKKFLTKLISMNSSPPEPQSYYLLGYILEKEKAFAKAALFYKDAIRSGFSSIEPIWRLLKISCYLKEKDEAIKYANTKYEEFKRGFIRMKRLSLRKGKKIAEMRRIERQMAIFEERLAQERR